MAIKRFSGSFRTRDDVFDNITPNNMVQPKVSHPAGEWKPAAWLPVQWKGEASQDYFVISSGKVVSLTSDGRVVPSGLRKNTVAADPIFTYTSNDVSAKTEDIRTGEALAANATMAVTLQSFCEAVIERGFVDHGALTINGTTVAFDSVTASDDNADAVEILELYISAPVGVCAYDVYSWAGDSPASLKHVNYQKQHLIQFITEAQMKMPQMANNTQVSAITIGSTAFAAATHGNFPGGAASLILTASALNGLERYDRESDEVLYSGGASASVEAIYLGVKNLVPEINALTVADQNTKITVSGTDIEAAVVNAKSRIQDIGKLGDYFFDAAVGVLFLHSDFDVASASADTISPWQYGSAASSDHRHIYCVGPVKPGDYLTFDVESNFTALNVAASTLQSDICGRVLEIQSFPKSLMERTTTAWQGSSFDASMRMPGSATEGLPDNLTLSGQNGEVVGNRMVIANIRIL